jgi:short-subunit dehydrogenase
VDDLARSLTQCIDNKDVIGKTYFAETESKTFGEIFRIIQKKVHNKNPSMMPMPSFRGIVGRIHRFLPVPVNNLFIDYLYTIDDDFRRELLKDVKPVKFSDGVDDVIAANASASGYWVITGANSGIGLALARKLKAKKKRLILIDKNIDIISKEFKSTEKGESMQTYMIIIAADLSDITQIRNIVNKIYDYPIYCLVNNAGIGYRKSFDAINFEEIQRIIAVNIEAHIYMTKFLLTKLKREGSIILNVASSIAYNPLPNMLMYSSTKAFISNWSESLTYELKDTNKVITFSPSGTNTKFQEHAGVKKEDEGKGLLTPEKVADKMLSAVKNSQTVVIMGLKTKILLIASSILPRKANIVLWGKLFAKMR